MCSSDPSARKERQVSPWSWPLQPTWEVPGHWNTLSQKKKCGHLRTTPKVVLWFLYSCTHLHRQLPCTQIPSKNKRNIMEDVVPHPLFDTGLLNPGLFSNYGARGDIKLSFFQLHIRSVELHKPPFQVYVVLGIKSSALCMPGKQCTNRTTSPTLHPQLALRNWSSKQLVQGHAANKWHRQNLKLRPLNCSIYLDLIQPQAFSSVTLWA